MKQILKIITILLLIISYSMAQQDNDLGQKLRQLGTKLVILKAAAQKYNYPNVLDIVNKAYDEYNIALEFLKQLKIGKARAHFIKAYKFAEQAERILRSVLFKPLARYRVELDKLIHQAEIAVHRSNNEEARYLLTKARAFHVKANQAFNSQRFIQGQEYYRIALYFANKAIELTKSTQSGNQQRTDYEEQLRNTENLFKDIYSSNNNISELNELLKKADLFLLKSKNNYENGNYKQAIFQLQICERLLYRAIDLSQSTADGKKESILSNLNSLKRYIDGIENSLSDNKTVNSVRLLRKARQFYRGAQRDIEKGNYQSARSKIVLAQRMATRALRHASIQDQTENYKVLERINEVERLIQLQKQKIDINDGRTIIFFHKEAKELLSKAKLSYEKGEHLSAFRKMQLAFRLVNRVELLLGDKKRTIRTKEELETQISQLNALLNKIKQHKNERISSTVPQLFRLLDKAETHLKNGDSEIATELLNLIQSQVNVLLKEAVN